MLYRSCRRDRAWDPGWISPRARANRKPASHKQNPRVSGHEDRNISSTGNVSGSIWTTAATTTYSGTIEVTVNITLKTALPSGDVIACSVDAVASSESETTATSVAYDDSAASLATVSGSSATCKVNIPFSWVLGTPSTTVIDRLTRLDVVMYSPTATTITDLLEDFVREHAQAITINGGKPGDGTLSLTKSVTL